jgi:hypothetical protein
VGPGNSYGKKEQNSAFWLKLFLLLKEASVSTDGVLSLKWRNEATEQDQMLQVSAKGSCGVSMVPFYVQIRYFMSYVINGAGFFILLHLLPLQVAAESSGIGVVFRAVGMIYLVNLDDTSGNTMTLIQREEDAVHEQSFGSVTNKYGFLSTLRIFKRDDQEENGSNGGKTESSHLLQ